jgi:hypothetical protein
MCCSPYVPVSPGDVHGGLEKGEGINPCEALVLNTTVAPPHLSVVNLCAGSLQRVIPHTDTWQPCFPPAL